MAATDSNDARASFSNANADVEIAAAGVDVLSTKRGGGYVAFSGTSMATPHVAGVAALIAAKNPSFTARADPRQARHLGRRQGRRGPRPAVRLRPRQPGSRPSPSVQTWGRRARPPGRSGGLHAALRPGPGLGARSCGRRGRAVHERVRATATCRRRPACACARRFYRWAPARGRRYARLAQHVPDMLRYRRAARARRRRALPVAVGAGARRAACCRACTRAC